MAIKLLLHHILVKLDDAIEADEDLRRARDLGIVIQLDKREEAAVEFGTVAQVGPLAYVDLGRDPSIVKVGDRVSVVRYAGKKITDTDGTKYVLFNDQDILAIIE